MLRLRFVGPCVEEGRLWLTPLQVRKRLDDPKRQYKNNLGMSP
jgi:hypothetical protein